SSIIFIVGSSMNDALGAAGRARKALFEALGYDHVEVNFSSPGAQELLNRTVSETPIEFAYGVVGMGGDIRGMTSEGQEVNFWEANRIPFIAPHGDSPAYFFARHVMPSPWHACVYFYPEHLELRRRFPLEPALYGVVPPVPFDMVDKAK